MTQEQIAKRLKISQKNVSKNLSKAIEKLRNHISTLQLLDFLYIFE
jgi:DNA-directed RNA polymerase specialized sigma subunit